MFGHILIATDGSDLAQKAAASAVALAEAVGARMTAVTIVAPFHAYDVLPSEVTNDLSGAYIRYLKDVNADEILAGVARLADARRVRSQVMQIEQQHAHQGIIKVAAEQNCDLIVMASHGRRGHAAALLGSVTAKVLAHATIPVLIYH